MEKKRIKLAIFTLTTIIFISITEQVYAKATYTAPTGPTSVDSDVVTATAHRDATPLPEMLGANTVCGFGMINGGVVTSNNVLGNFALEVWGSKTNNANPDPYWCNFYWNFVNDSGDKYAPASDVLLNLNYSGSPIAADTLTISSSYGGVSVSLYRRPDVLIGVATGNDVTDDTGYNEQLSTIAATGEVYNPLLAKYNPYTLETMIDTVYDAAEVLETSGKVTRYGEPLKIADDYANYIFGIKGYIKDQIGEENYKTIAIVSKVNSDGTYTIVGEGATSPTSTNRFVEYTYDVTNNLTSSSSENVSSEELSNADAIILSSDTVEEAVKSDAVIMEKEPEIISMNLVETLYGVKMNSVENAMGMGYILARIYDDQESMLSVKYIYEYFASKFYHIRTNRLDYIYLLGIVENLSTSDIEYMNLNISDNSYYKTELESIYADYAQ